MYKYNLEISERELYIIIQKFSKNCYPISVLTIEIKLLINSKLPIMKSTPHLKLWFPEIRRSQLLLEPECPWSTLGNIGRDGGNGGHMGKLGSERSQECGIESKLKHTYTENSFSGGIEALKRHVQKKKISAISKI